MTNRDYDRLIKKKSPPSPLMKDMLLAFLVGGAICALGEGLSLCYETFLTNEKSCASLVSVSLVFLSAVLTALGLYDKLAKHAGAGTLVPITGFANAVVSPAIEYKPEGQILGVAAKMFTIAGPVIVFGTLASAIYGVVYWLFTQVL